jgi:hypothetical protein
MEPPSWNNALTFGDRDRLQQEAVAVFQFEYALLIGPKQETRTFGERHSGFDLGYFAYLDIHGPTHKSPYLDPRKRGPSTLRSLAQRRRIA